MRVPLSWLAEYAALGAPLPDAGEVARRLTAAGLEVETFGPAGHDISGVVVAQVTAVEELTGFRKPVRYCEVSTGTGAPRMVICGAVNFAAGDRVPFAQPGAVLPGGFQISAKKAYGRMSEGMICSAAELGIGDDHSGILVLAPDAPLGADFVTYAGLADHVFEIAVTPDRGYALSIRGVARELATAFGVAYTDPASTSLPDDVETVSAGVYPASIDDPTACDRFVLREVRGFQPASPTPLWMRVRLARCGMRSVSLAVDITNYLMLELGQPLHAFDAAQLTGPIVVRRAKPGERLETLDHVVRDLDSEDILITDASGPISLAGTMGGLATEISGTSRDLVIEAAHFSARGTARMSRRHRLFSEASYRFERGVDRELPLRASARAVRMLASLGGASVKPGCSHASAEVPQVSITMPAGYPDRVAGQEYGPDTVVRRLRDVGCEVPDPGAATLTVVPPSWRPDLVAPSDLAEEVIRLEGYENIPARMPRATAGHGLTDQQRLDAAIGRALAGTGCVEVLSHPFVSAGDYDRLQLPADDPRRTSLRLANPLSEDEPLLRTTLLPGLLRVLARNVGRGFADLALFEMGMVFRPRPGSPGVAPILRVEPGTDGSRGGLAGSGPARAAAAACGGPGREPRTGRLVGEGPGRWLAGRHRGQPRGAAGQPGALPGGGRPARTLAPGPLRGHFRHRRAGGAAAGRACWRTAPPGSGGVPTARPHLRGRARPVRDRDRGGRTRPGRGADHLALPGGDPGRGPGGGGVGARRRGGGGAVRWRGRPGGRQPARGGRAVRRLHRGAGRGGPQVARLHTAVPRPGPDAHRRGGHRGA